MDSEQVQCGHCGCVYHFSDDHDCVQKLKRFRDMDTAIIEKLQDEVESLERKVEWLEQEMSTEIED